MCLAGDEDVLVVPLVKFGFIISGLKLCKRILNSAQKVDLLELPAIHSENNINHLIGLWIKPENWYGKNRYKRASV